MPVRRLLEVEPSGPLRYLIGAAIMMIGVVLPIGYMMFRTKRVPSSSSYAKQTQSKHLVQFTGAESSTCCGIPDFRGPNLVWTLQELPLQQSIHRDMNIFD